jgi:peptide/nickel transport system permease protein
MATGTTSAIPPIRASAGLHILEAADGVPDELSRRESAARILRPLVRSKLRLFGASVLIIFVICALLAPIMSPADPAFGELTQRVRAPSLLGGPPGHVLGTDQLGRDILSRLIHGARVSLVVGLSAVAMAGSIGIVLGLVSGYYGGWTDALIMRLADVQLALPGILLAIAILSALGPGLFNVILVLGIGGWTGYARIVRGQVLSHRERDYVVAARGLGVPSARIIARHLLPNSVTPAVVLATFAVAQAIVTEAALSFLGLGVGVQVPTWGNMLADGRAYVATAWWLAMFPGIAISLVVLSINLLGDWLRDVLDPRMRNLL